jgi:hypothetical protein
LEGKTTEWLCGEIDRSVRWIQALKNPENLDLKDINKLSELLDFNFIEDYNQWLVLQHQPPLYIMKEPAGVYNNERRRQTVMIKISAPVKIVEDNLSKMMKEVRLSGEKLGFEID